jgi:uncharacterized protein
LPAILRTFAWVLVCLAAAAGADWRALKPEGRVSDFAGVIDAASRQQLEAYLAAVERQTGAQIALVTVRSLDGDPIEDAANTLFRAWGIGQKGRNNGVLLMLAIQERQSRLEVGYEIEPLVPDSLAGQVLDEMRPALRRQQYGEAMLAAAQKVGSTLARAKGVTIDTTLRRRIVNSPGESVPWPALIGGGFLLLMFLASMRQTASAGRRRRGPGAFPLLLPPFSGGSARPGGGGGFGGYDSGDSFGGFGGGDSGGGGASSDW